MGDDSQGADFFGWEIVLLGKIKDIGPTYLTSI